MKSHSILNRNNGFTLIELLVVIALIIVISSIGMLLSLDFYRTYAFKSESDIIISMLQKARNQSLSNINQKPHGIHFETGKYVLYQGSSYNAADTNNLVVTSAPTVSATATPTNILFDQLTGSATAGSITLTSNGATKIINVNAEGRIDVQ